MKLKKVKAVARFRKDANGELIRDERGNLVERYGWYYGLTDYTPEELTMFKRMQTQTGTSYYQEMKGHPVLWLNENIGFSADAEFYKRKDGTIGISADTTEIVELKAAIQKYGHNPLLAQQFALELEALLRRGGRLDLAEKVVNEQIPEEDL